MKPRKVAVIAMVVPALGAWAQDVLPNLPTGPLVARLEIVATGLGGEVGGTAQYFPTQMEALPDGSGRRLILTLGGVVRLLRADGTLAAEPYLDITNPATLVTPTNFGMTSLAVHPGFGDPQSPGYGAFYLVETEMAGSGVPDFDDSLAQVGFGGVHQEVLVEYRAADASADVFAGSRRVLFRIEQPGWDHNVFDLAFGVGDEAGLMYIASGDGANASQGVSQMRANAQTLANFYGKVLRIDPLGTDGVTGEYGVPPSNPFVGVAGARPEVYSYGHRAPYRLMVDRETGEVWVGEVGQKQIEEVNRVVAGGNYGWPLKEGSFLFDQLNHIGAVVDTDADGDGTGDFAASNGLIDPVFEYDHGTGLAVIGGAVYRGERWPLLRGRYVCADFVRGGVLQGGFFHGDPASGPVSGATGEIVQFRVDPSGSAVPTSVVSLAEDGAGELYLLGSLGGDGVVVRIRNGCPADLAEPAGVLDLADVTAFASGFLGQAAATDIAAPEGVFDLADVSAFVQSFLSGCP